MIIDEILLNGDRPIPSLTRSGIGVLEPICADQGLGMKGLMGVLGWLGSLTFIGDCGLKWDLLIRGLFRGDNEIGLEAPLDSKDLSGTMGLLSTGGLTFLPFKRLDLLGDLAAFGLLGLIGSRDLPPLLRVFLCFLTIDSMGSPPPSSTLTNY